MRSNENLIFLVFWITMEWDSGPDGPTARALTLSSTSELNTMSNLDNFISSSRPPPKSIAISQEIRDRASTFVGAIYHATSYAEAQTAIRHHAQVVHGAKKASHEMTAWRFMALKHGRDGLKGPEDFELKSGSEDDGEDSGGRKVLRTMEAEGVLDAVVIVSRWYAMSKSL